MALNYIEQKVLYYTGLKFIYVYMVASLVCMQVLRCRFCLEEINVLWYHNGSVREDTQTLHGDFGGGEQIVLGKYHEDLRKHNN